MSDSWDMYEGESVFDPTYGGEFGEVVGENVFDPNYGGQFGEVVGESVFDPGSAVSWEDEFAKTIGVTPDPNDKTWDNANSPSNAEILKTINADTSGILKKLFTDKDGKLNLQALGGVGGGILGALGALRPDTKKVGYQGSIPKYDAVRNMVTAPPATVGGKPYRPGQGGINWGGDVSYVPKGTATTGDAAAPVEEVKAAQGGLMGLAKGRYLQGGTDGMADKIPARIGKDQPAALSHGEFVIPADVVSHLGNGNSDAGAKKLYQMMDKIRQARTGTKKQGKQINPDKFMPGGLARAYAQGGAIKHYETGGSVSGLGTAANAGVTGSETGPNTWAGEYMSDMLGKGQALSNAPYQQYGGPLTAGASDLQNKVFTGLQGTTFPGNLGASFSSAGAPTIGADGQPVGGGTNPAAQYMNPYLQSVLDPQLAEMRRQNQITNVGTNARLTSAGAFGGGRQAIMNAENDRNMMQEMNKTVGQGYANAYDKAMNQFNTEQTQGMGLARFIADQGGQQRGIEAEGVAADKKAFEEAREHPYKMVQYQQSLLNGLPISANNIETAKPSTLQEAIKGAGGLAGMFKNQSNISLADLTSAMKNLGFEV